MLACVNGCQRGWTAGHETLQVAADEEEEEAGAGGYSAAYARLHNAAFVEPDPFPSIQDTSKYLAESISRFSQVRAQLDQIEQ